MPDVAAASMGNPFKVLSVIGTRPDTIKMAPVILELAAVASASGGRLVSRVLATAQHRQMLDQAASIFGIVPDIDLDVMRDDQRLDDLAARTISSVSAALAAERPDLVLVHGDTTTAMAAALAAFYNKVPAGHVEAGLRTADIYSPYPEEMNRRMCAVICSRHYAPTALAAKNLEREGVAREKILVTGNTVVDALGLILSKSARPVSHPAAAAALDSGARTILVTAHRRENFGLPLERMCGAFLEIVRELPDAVIIYPVHLNPNVKKVVEKLINGHDRIILMPPVEYLEFVTLMSRSHLILTDSGGIQEEAVTLKKPVLVMREVTERPELIECGCGRLVGSDSARIVAGVTGLFRDPAEYAAMSRGAACFGDGTAAARIAADVAAMAGV